MSANLLSNYLLLSVIILIIGFGQYKKISIYENFVTGAKEGGELIVNILPHFVGMVIAIGMFRASGALEYVIKILAPICNIFSIPVDIVPLGLLRPLSGSGSRAALIDLIETKGIYSLETFIGSVMMGSTETTFYVIAIYFGGVGIVKSRYALKVGLIADFAGLVSSIFIAKFFY